MSGDTRALCVFFRIEAPPVSWLWRFNSAFEKICAAFPPWRRIATIRRAGQWPAPQTSSPYSRAAATDFHRLPVRGVSCGCLRLRDHFRIRLRSAVKALRGIRSTIETCFGMPPRGVNNFRAKSRAAARPDANPPPAALRTLLQASSARTLPPECRSAAPCHGAAGRCGPRIPPPD